MTGISTDVHTRNPAEILVKLPEYAMLWIGKTERVQRSASPDHRGTVKGFSTMPDGSIRTFAPELQPIFAASIRIASSPMSGIDYLTPPWGWQAHIDNIRELWARASNTVQWRPAK